MGRMAPGLAVSLAVGAAVVLSSGPARAAPFDGIWSVNIITQAGECDRGYRYRVRIANGTVQYVGDSGFTISGRVAASGAVTVTVSRGNQRATASGRLAGARGGGLWRGASGTGACSGRWEADRRG